MSKKWYDMSESELENELSTNAVNGLSKKAAHAASKKNGENVIFKLPHGSFFSYLKDIATDSSSVILILAAVTAAFFDSSISSYVIISLIGLNCFVSLFAYVKAHRVIEGMSEYSLPGAKVIRDGHLYLTRMTSLVPGDLIYLKAGDIVPADARVISAENFYVSERGITENVSAIRKSPQNISAENKSPENLFNMVFATSVVLKGSARAIVVETGDSTYTVRTGGNDLSFDNDSLDIFTMLKSYGGKISMLMLAMVVVIMFLEIAIGLKVRGLYEIFLNGMTLAVAAMTEFYIAFGYIIVACGLFAARTDKGDKTGIAVVKNIKSLEKLRDINCIIFKKDGVLSKRRKTVDSFYYCGQHFEVKNYSKGDEFRPLLEGAVISTGFYMMSSMETRNNLAYRSISAGDAAVVECAEKYGVYNIGLDRNYPMLLHTGAGRNSAFDMTAVDNGGKVYAYVKGPSAEILSRCSRYSIGKSVIPIDTALSLNLGKTIDEYEKGNTEVIAVAVCETNVETLSRGQEAVISEGLTLLGFIALKSSFYESTALTIDKLIHSGIKLIVNSPGGSASDIAAAKSLGICRDDSDILTQSLFTAMSDETLSLTAASYSVYSGLQNSSLRKIIKTLSESGYNVAYCAGGLSEITVMESADISISQTELPMPGKKASREAHLHNVNSAEGGGSDALRFKSDILIPSAEHKKEGGIIAVAKSILTSKLIYKNIINMIAYLITVQFARLFIVFYSVFTQDNILTPLQILVGGLIFDLLAVLSIAFTRPCSRTLSDYESAKREMKVLPRFYLKNALFGVFWAAMTIFVPQIMTGIGHPVTGQDLVNCSFISFTALQFLTLAEVKRTESIFKPSSLGFNPVYAASLCAAALFTTLCVLLEDLGQVFNISGISRDTAISAAVIFVLVLAVYEIYKSISLKK